MKHRSSFNLDYNNYNERIIRNKSAKYSRYKVVISFTAIVCCLALLFISLSSASNKAEEDTTIANPVINEQLELPPENNESVQTGKPTVLKIENTTQPEQTEQAQTKPIISAENKLIESKTPKPQKNDYKFVSYTVKSGDSLASIFKQHHLSKTLLHNLVHSTEHGKQLARIKPGQKLTFGFADNWENTLNSENKKPNDDSDRFRSISLKKTKLETLTIARHNNEQNKFTSTIKLREVEKREKFVNVVINGSLFLSATKAGLSESFTMELAHLFGWDIDFALDIRNGDSFSVLFNEHYLDGKKIANGQILAAEFINQGKLFESIYFTDESGKSDYYSADGYSKRKAFLRTPVAFTRISSKFSRSRKHPIYKIKRAHKGVDYAAPRGTPVKSSGDGKVVFKGRKGGYGKLIEVQHGSKYKTVYGHLSSYNRKVKRGSRVKQGQVIGYVGSTGAATGPHLHYEFRVNGVHRNPLTVTLPKANPINTKYRADFLSYSDNILSTLKLKKHEYLALLQE